MTDEERIAECQAALDRQVKLQTESLALFAKMATSGLSEEEELHYWSINDEIQDLRTQAVDDRGYLLELTKRLMRKSHA